MITITCPLVWIDGFFKSPVIFPIFTPEMQRLIVFRQLYSRSRGLRRQIIPIDLLLTNPARHTSFASNVELYRTLHSYLFPTCNTKFADIPLLIVSGWIPCY